LGLGLALARIRTASVSLRVPCRGAEWAAARNQQNRKNTNMNTPNQNTPAESRRKDSDTMKTKTGRWPAMSGVGRNMRSALAALALVALPAVALAQNDATLASLVPSAGTLTPAFASGTFSYTANVPYTTTDITVTPTAADPGATITVNGNIVTSGSPSGPISLSVGTNVITNVVVSADTTVTNTYALTVTRTAISTNANLASLVTSAGTLTPAFNSNTLSYAATVPYSAASITVTPTAANAFATITVDGNPVLSGNPSDPINLNLGANVITTVVVSQDATATNTYTLTVTRPANAELANLVPSVGTLNPVFDSATLSYTATSPFTNDSVTVTPTASDFLATIKVNGIAVNSGDPSGAISLNLGDNFITTLVVSADTTATNTYTLNVIRDGPITVVNTLTYTNNGPNSSTYTVATGYPVTGVDKLVVTVAGENANPNGTGLINSVTYAGQAMTLAIKVDNRQGAYPEGALGIYYLDNPSQYGTSGDIVASVANFNSGSGSVMSLVGTAPGLGATNAALVTVATTTESVSVVTKTEYNVVIAANANGIGNTGVQPFPLPPLTQVLSVRKTPANFWTGAASGYQFVKGLATATSTFSNASTLAATTIAASFGVAIPTLNWDIDGATAGAGGATPAGAWDATTANWNADYLGTGAAAIWTNGMAASFAAGTDATGAYTVAVDGTKDIIGLTFEEGEVTVSGGTALRLSSFTVLDAAAGLAATVATPLSEDATGRKLVKAGAGTVTLAGNNTYTGDTTIAPAGGTLVLAGNNTAATGGMTINGGGARFELPASINGTARNVTVNSNGVAAFGPSFGAGNIPAALSGRIVAASTGAIAADNYGSTAFNFSTPGLTAASLGAVGNVTYTGKLTPNSTTYRLGGGGGTLTLANANAVTGTGNSLVIKGNVTLSSANDFTAGTTLNAGNLGVGNDNCLGSGSLVFNGGGISSDSTAARTVPNAATFTTDTTMGSAVNNGKLTFIGPAGLGTVNRGITIDSDVELAGIVSGVGFGFTKNGTNTMTLSGANTYSGTTVNNIGTMVLAGSNNSAGATTVNNGTLQLGGSANGGLAGGTLTIGALIPTVIQPVGADRTITNSVSLTYNASAGGTALISGSQNLAISGIFTFANGGGGNRTLISSLDSGKALTLSGQVRLTDSANAKNQTINVTNEARITGVVTNGGTGVGSLTKAGPGLLVLANNNRYTGVTTVGGGVLLLNSATALPGGIGTTGGTNNLTFNGGVVGLGAGDFTRSLNTAATTTAATFTGNGGWAAYGEDRVVNLGGASDTISWATANTGFNGKRLILGATTATHTVTLQNPLTLDVATCTVQVDDGAATVDATLSGGLLDGGGGLTKIGTGTLQLTAANTYSGDTTIGGGTLRLGSSGSIANTPLINVQTSAKLDVSAVSGFTLGSGQTLMGNGTVLGAVTVNGTVSPGASVGTLNSGSQTWNGGSAYQFELSSAVNSAGMDLLNLTGTLNVQATAGNKFTLRLVSMADTNTPGLVPDFSGYISYTWLLATASGGILNFDASKFAIDASAFANGYIGTFSVGTNANSLLVNYTAPVLVPPTLNSFGPLSGGLFPLTFSGPDGQPYTVLTSTNVALPQASWTVLESGTFGASPVTYTDTGATNAQQFYRVKSP
jgi:autotransporter-associated beta strand protein